MSPARREDVLSLADKERIDEVCLAFEDIWLAGERPLIEHHLEQVPAALRAGLLKELLLIDLEYRRGLAEMPDVHDYLLRFPAHENMVRRVFATVQQRPTHLSFLPGHTIGRYRIQAMVGSGAFGTVYRAWDEELHRDIAIKVPHRSRLDSGFDQDQFVGEARAVARLKHPGIVAVYDSGRLDDDSIYLVMPYIDGRALRHLLQNGPLEPDRAVEILIQVAEAVHCAHSSGLIHRDLKPGNILMDREGHAHVADFGLALREAERSCSAEEWAGTLANMAPEQIRGDLSQLDARADIWAMGVILFEMLTGTTPFRGATDAELAEQILGQAPRPPRQLNARVPRAIEQICLRCLAKRPDQRFSSARDVAGALRRRGLDQRRRTNWLVFAASLCGLAVLLMVSLRLRGNVRPNPSRSAHRLHALDLLIWKANNDARDAFRLSTAQNRSLWVNDQVRVEVRMDKAAFLYIVWLDSRGQALPVYPWRKGDWSLRPSREEPSAYLTLPEEQDEGWFMEEAPCGTETVLLLARGSPLPGSLDVRGLLSTLRWQMPARQETWWFQDGRLTQRKSRAPHLAETMALDDPLLKLHQQLVETLRPHFELVHSVSFPFCPEFTNEDQVTRAVSEQ